MIIEIDTGVNNMSQEILKVVNLTKIYPGGTLANYNINFSINRGEIHALVGENGAGKSTLMKMLFGMEEITSGEMFLEGKKVTFSSSKEAIAHGIGMVHQHMMLVPSLTVAENLTLGMEKKKGLFVDKKKCVQEAEEISKKYNLYIEPTKKVRDISVGMKQKIEILKTMYRGAKIIILDEPTAVLTPQETSELFEQLLKLKEQGYTIIFISHKLNEVKYLCDRLTVLKAGRSVGTYQVKDVTSEEISKLMVGRDVKLEYKKEEITFGETVLKVKDLNYSDKFGIKKLHNLCFSLKEGEILGVAGIEGNGQREAMDIITGNLRQDSGSVWLKNEEISHQSVTAIRQRGINYVPEDRNDNGCALEMSVRDNIIGNNLEPFSKKLNLLDFKALENHCNEMVKNYNVKTANNDVAIKSLSGGNVQKAIIARECSEEAEVIILNQPTRGVDIGAMEFIHKKILDMRMHKKSMILVAADLTELKALSDRIIVINQGEVVGVIHDVAHTTEEELGLYMLGLKKDSQEQLMEA